MPDDTVGYIKSTEVKDGVVWATVKLDSSDKEFEAKLLDANNRNNEVFPVNVLCDYADQLEGIELKREGVRDFNDTE